MKLLSNLIYLAFGLVGVYILYQIYLKVKGGNSSTSNSSGGGSSALPILVGTGSGAAVLSSFDNWLNQQTDGLFGYGPSNLTDSSTSVSSLPYNQQLLAGADQPVIPVVGGVDGLTAAPDYSNLVWNQNL